MEKADDRQYQLLFSAKWLRECHDVFDLKTFLIAEINFPTLNWHKLDLILLYFILFYLILFICCPSHFMA